MHAPIAQLDRVTDYESVGRGFESLSAYQNSRYPFGYLLFLFTPERTRKTKCKAPVEPCLPPVLTAATPYFAPQAQRQRVPFGVCLQIPAFFRGTPKGWTRTLSAYHAERFRRTPLPEWQQSLSLFLAVAAKRQLSCVLSVRKLLRSNGR